MAHQLNECFGAVTVIRKNEWTTLQTVMRQTGIRQGDSENKGAVWSICY